MAQRKVRSYENVNYNIHSSSASNITSLTTAQIDRRADYTSLDLDRALPENDYQELEDSQEQDLHRGVFVHRGKNEYMSFEVSKSLPTTRGLLLHSQEVDLTREMSDYACLDRSTSLPDNVYQGVAIGTEDVQEETGHRVYSGVIAGRSVCASVVSVSQDNVSIPMTAVPLRDPVEVVHTPVTTLTKQMKKVPPSNTKKSKCYTCTLACLVISVACVIIALVAVSAAAYTQINQLKVTTSQQAILIGQLEATSFHIEECFPETVTQRLGPINDTVYWRRVETDSIATNRTGFHTLDIYCHYELESSDNFTITTHIQSSGGAAKCYCDAFYPSAADPAGFLPIGSLSFDLVCILSVTFCPLEQT